MFKQCYHEEPADRVKLTVVLARVLTHMMRTVIEDLGLMGIGVVVVGLGVYLWRPLWGKRKGSLG
jgi:hypothetical protein